MGTAILQGLLTRVKPEDQTEIKCTACVRSKESLSRLQKIFENENRVEPNSGHFVEAANNADVVFLGVPPTELGALLDEPGLIGALQNKVVISLLAGISCERVATALKVDSGDGAGKQETCHILRVIPSIGAKANDSVSLIADTTFAGEDGKQICRWLFEQLGTAMFLAETLMDDATAAGAACHALTIVATDAIVDTCVAEGMPRAAAMQLAASSLRSSAGLLATSMTPESLKEAMSVPSGITINALLQLDRANTRAAISDATRHAIHYTRKMASS
ncbi:pyrroline-5-carboxylate reductase [Polychaeton citri CBS 116435]|uniref:Pyrroline-5-carboxylate reductase n=1 Tax=Polychaeton citri CBS 116435 TaxID=1314669 RepID=A0A9P4UPN8_9PEZI|nr:pyrroline-5-carboxylate reductase [Polychaeton citri CBS 116435]